MHFEINGTPAQVAQARARLETTMALTNADADLLINRLLTHDVILTEAAAEAMSVAGTKRTKGEPISLSYLLLWGGPGVYRAYGEIEVLKAENAALKGQLTEIATQLASLTK
jgi:hypothetical protein